MAKISERFICSYFSNKMLESIKPLNAAKDALDASEQQLKEKLDSIIKEIMSIEF